MRCKHKGLRITRWASGADEAFDVNICARCHAWLPLGESDERENTQVRIEIRAAEIAQEIHEYTAWRRDSTQDENDGFDLRESRNVETDGYQTGYLARCIVDHERDHERDHEHDQKKQKLTEAVRKEAFVQGWVRGYVRGRGGARAEFTAARILALLPTADADYIEYREERSVR
ncbi:MAG: hypothetical protein Q6370_014480 [Candidatus Sigynarchaeota archaeon]|jgi:hypothetical protein